MAWLKKLLGRHHEDHFDPDEEPSRVEPVRHIQTGVQEAARNTTSGNGKPKGFDPYNSGSFKRDNAWERVTRK
jgi:hypothetical protein